VALPQIHQALGESSNAAVAEPTRTTAIAISTRLRNTYLRALTAAAVLVSNRRRREPGFAGLAAIIVSQQVSVASANAIFGRLEAALAPLSAEAALAAGEEILRGCGLSGPKIRALTAVAEAVAGRGLDLAALAHMPAPEAHRALVAVKGIGPWTADIFLLFCLGHPDAFPAGDLALQEAAKLALDLKTRPDALKLERHAERWRPYRGVAARMLWAYYRVAKQRAGVIDLDAASRLAETGEAG